MSGGSFGVGKQCFICFATAVRIRFFCDTSSDKINGRLKIIDLLLALHKSVVSCNLCSLNDFDVNEYEFLHTCEEGVNMTWVVPSTTRPLISASVGIV